MSRSAQKRDTIASRAPEPATKRARPHPEDLVHAQPCAEVLGAAAQPLAQAASQPQLRAVRQREVIELLDEEEEEEQGQGHAVAPRHAQHGASDLHGTGLQHPSMQQLASHSSGGVALITPPNPPPPVTARGSSDSPIYVSDDEEAPPPAARLNLQAALSPAAGASAHVPTAPARALPHSLAPHTASKAARQSGGQQAREAVVAGVANAAAGKKKQGRVAAPSSGRRQAPAQAAPLSQPQAGPASGSAGQVQPPAAGQQHTNLSLYNTYMARGRQPITVWSKLVQELKPPKRTPKGAVRAEEQEDPLRADIATQFEDLPIGSLVLACNLGPGYRSTSAECCAGCAANSHTKWHPMLVSLSARHDEGNHYRQPGGLLVPGKSQDRLCCEFLCSPQCLAAAQTRLDPNLRNVLPQLAAVRLQLPPAGHTLLVAPSVVKGLRAAVEHEGDASGWKKFRKEVRSVAWAGVAQQLPQEVQELLEAL